MIIISSFPSWSSFIIISILFVFSHITLLFSCNIIHTQKTPSTIDREQAMRDYKLSIEYKHLKQHCPGGVYLLPSSHSLRTFHGVIFVRRGIFTNGIFKFVLECDPRYNDVNLHPRVTFSSYVYNPHVHPVTGELDLKVAYPEWDSSKH